MKLIMWYFGYLNLKSTFKIDYNMNRVNNILKSNISILILKKKNYWDDTLFCVRFELAVVDNSYIHAVDIDNCSIVIEHLNLIF